MYLKETGLISAINVDFQSQSAGAVLSAYTGVSTSSDSDGFSRTLVATDMRPSAGYMIKTEQVVHEADETEFEMKTAYTMNDEYIGDPEWAQRLSDMGIKPQLASPKHKVCSIGFCEKENKWYGWSHRAISGFGVGSEVGRGHCAYKPASKKEFLQGLDDWYRYGGNQVEVVPTATGAIVNTTSFRVTDNKPLQYTHVEEFHPGRGAFTVKDMAEAEQLAKDFAESVSACSVNVDTAIVQEAVLEDLAKRFQEQSARMLTRANQLLRIQRYIKIHDVDSVPLSADEAVAQLPEAIQSGTKTVNDSAANLGITTRKASNVQVPTDGHVPEIGTPPKDVEDVGPVVGDEDEDPDYDEKLERLKARHGNPNYIEQEINQSISDMFGGVKSPVSLSMESYDVTEVLAECAHSRIERSVTYFDEYAPASGTPYAISKEDGHKCSILDVNMSDFKVMDERCAAIIHTAREKLIANREAYNARSEEQKARDNKWTELFQKLLTPKEMAGGLVRAVQTDGIDGGMASESSEGGSIASESAAKFAPTEFSWFRYMGKKTRSFDHHKQDIELEIETNERFGIMYNSRLKKYIIVEASMFGRNGEVYEFRADEKELKLMVKASKPFNGKVGGQKIVKGDPLNLQLFVNRKQVASKTVITQTVVEPNKRSRVKKGVKIVKRLDQEDVVDGVKIKRKPVFLGAFQPNGNDVKLMLIVNESLTALKKDLQERMSALPNLGSFSTIYQLRADHRFVVKALKNKVTHIKPAHKTALERESGIKPETFKGKNIRLRNDSVEVPQFKPGKPDFTEPMFFGNQLNVLAEIRDAIVLDKYFSGAFTLLDPKGYVQKKSYKRTLSKGKPSERRSKMGLKELKSQGLVFLELVATHDSNAFEDEAYALLIRLRKVFDKKITGQVEVKRLKLDGVDKEYLVVRLIANIKPVDKETRDRAIRLYNLMESNQLSIGINQYGVPVGSGETATLLPCSIVEPVYTKGALKVQPTNMQLKEQVTTKLFDLNGTRQVF